MRLNFDVLKKVQFIIGSMEDVLQLPFTSAFTPFDKRIVDFLNEVSKEVMKDPRSKAYSDVVTFGFWIRKGSVLKLKDRFCDNGVHLGKGVAFHIAPSNVPVNFAYSLVSGLLCGNANVVRIPSKDYPQVQIITDSFKKILARYDDLRKYVICVRYDRDKDINDIFSSICNVRILWGGDQTIAELRNSPLPPRSGEITFADRYSLAVIDSDTYMSIDDKDRVAEDFYNDTFFSDQNACTSPRMIIWTGNQTEEAKIVFWEREYELVKSKYIFQPIQGINKLSKAYLLATNISGVKIETRKDNFIFRVKVSKIVDHLMDYADNSGYFYEYDCKDILELIPIVNNSHCQTIAYIGNRGIFLPLIEAGVKGIDRIVPIGKTMDFDLIWDGYNLPAFMTRTIMMI